MSDIDHNSQVSMISLSDPAIAQGTLVNYTKVICFIYFPSLAQLKRWPEMQVPLSDDVQMDNGGTPFRGELLLITSGRGTRPPSLVLVNPSPPFNSTVILDNFFGRQFNSLNDGKIHPKSGVIFFTDSSCVFCF
jgi:gluconolactonase